MIIPFNKPHISGRELLHIAEASFNKKLSGDGIFTKKCNQWLEKKTSSHKALLTHSCTAALEMSALLLDIKPGDEIIMPSYTFVSTANAFALRGGIPVFIDIHDTTYNINENLIEEAITNKTKAIVPVHYAGVSCEMDSILALGSKYNISIIEDAAQGLMSSYKGKALGSLGDFGTLSFHETKNITCGEGGAILINKLSAVNRSEIIREKGTDRAKFLQGNIDKYTWQDIGSSYLPGEMTAAFLWGQLEEAEQITQNRIDIWNRYHLNLEILEKKGVIRRPTIPANCEHNAHMYHILINEGYDRLKIIHLLKEQGISAISHYIPLHTSPAGKKLSKKQIKLPITDKISTQIVRLPLWVGMSKSEIDYVCETLIKAF